MVKHILGLGHKHLHIFISCTHDMICFLLLKVKASFPGVFSAALPKQDASRPLQTCVSFAASFWGHGHTLTLTLSLVTWVSPSPLPLPIAF